MSDRDGATRLEGTGNPYSPDAPVRPGRPFYGRQELLDYVPERLRPATCRIIVLRGPRKIGKTSLLLHLVPALETGFLPVYFDLKGRSGRPLPDVVADMSAAAMAAAGLEPFPGQAPEDLEEAHRTLVTALEHVSQGRRVVFLVDEFDACDPAVLPEDAAGKNAHAYFRRLGSVDGGPSFVFAVGSLRSPDWPTEVREWFGSAPSRDIGVLDEESAKRLLVEPAAHRCSFTDLAKRTIVQLSGGHPYFLQALAAPLFEQPRIGPAEPVGLLEVMATVPRVLEERAEVFAWIWDGLEPLEQELVRAAIRAGEGRSSIDPSLLQEAMGTPFAGVPAERIQGALEGLRAQQVIRRLQSGDLVFVADLFRRWVAQQCVRLPERNAISTGEGRRKDECVHEAVVDDDNGETYPEDTVEALWWAAEHRSEVQRSDTFDGDPSSDGEGEPDEGGPGGGARGPKERGIGRTARRPLREKAPGRKANPALDGSVSEFERLLQLGLNSFLQGQYEVAIASYRHALALRPGHVEATLGLSRTLTENRQFSQALDVLRSMPETAGDVAQSGAAEIYLRWLDEVESDEATWHQVMEAALRALPDHPELQARKRGGRVLRIRRLLKDGRPLEAAAALGALSTEQRAELSDVQTSLLNALEEMTRRAHSDAGALFSLLRRQLASPTQAWVRHLGPLLDEAERAERFNPARAEELYRAAANTVEAAGLEGDSVPATLLERLQAGIGRTESRRLVVIEEQLDELCRKGDLDRAESLLEEHLAESLSEELEARLNELRTQRLLTARYNEAVACISSHAYPEARRLLSSIVSDTPGFVGPDGRSALSVLESLINLEQGTRGGRRRAWYWVAAIAAIVCGVVLLVYWPPAGKVDSAAGGGGTRVAGATGPGKAATEPMAVVLSSGTPAIEGHRAAVETPSPEPGAAAVAPPGQPHPTVGSRFGEQGTAVEETPAGAKTETKAGQPSVQKRPVQGGDSSGHSGVREGAAGTPKPRAAREESAPEAASILLAAQPRPPEQHESVTQHDAVSFGAARAPSRLPVSVPTRPHDASLPDMPSSSRPPSSPSDDPYEQALGGGETGDTTFGTTLARATRTDPGAARVYLGQGLHYEREGRLADALRALESAVQLDPRSADAHLALGRVYAALDKKQKAEAELRTVIHLDLYGAAGREARRLLRSLQENLDSTTREQP